jgi:glycosyltransferase involved in cell wall biosynthesis
MKRKKGKIAIFHCGFIYSGGGERIVLEEAIGLKRRGWEVSVFAPTLDPKKCYPEFVKKLQVKTFLPQLPRWFSYRFAFLMAASSLLAPIFFWRFAKFDAFLGANQPGAWIAFVISRILRKPYIVYLNQPNRLIYPRKVDLECGYQTERSYYFLDLIIKKIKPFVMWADKISFTRAHFMLTNGDYIGKIIEKIYSRNVIDCPAGAYPKAFSFLRLNPHTAYEGQFGIKNIAGKTFKIEKPYVLITNRHDPQKRFEYVILAFVKVLAHVPYSSLIIPGPATSHTPNLVKMAKKLGILDKVIFTGQIKEVDLQKLYREAAAYCYPSPEEDFGMGVMEAASWGVPTVAWNNAGPTVTVVNGETGFLAKPFDISDYADKIIYLLKNSTKRAQMGKAAWQRAKEVFFWDRHIEILEKAITHSLGFTS